jgi:hypothetical protein
MLTLGVERELPGRNMWHGTGNRSFKLCVFVSSEQWHVPMKGGTTPYIPARPKVRAGTQCRIMPPPSNSLLYEKVKIKTHDLTVLPLVLY